MEAAFHQADPGTGKAVVATLVGGLLSSNHRARNACQEALLTMDQSVTRHVRHIADQLDATNPSVKRLLRIIQRLEPASESQRGRGQSVKQAIIECLVTGDSQLAQMALCVLRSFPAPFGADLVASEAFRRARDTKRCQRLLQAAGFLGAPSLMEYLQVSSLMQSRSAVVREAAAHALMQIGPLPGAASRRAATADCG